MDENRKRALTSALSQIEKQFGKGAVMRMGDRVAEPVEVGGALWSARPRLVVVAGGVVAER